MSHQRYDLAVVGAGTAGLEIAKNASRSGYKAVSYTHLTLPTMCVV